MSYQFEKIGSTLVLKRTKPKITSRIIKKRSRGNQEEKSMKTELRPIVMAVALAMSGGALPCWAQSVATPAAPPAKASEPPASPASAATTPADAPSQIAQAGGGATQVAQAAAPSEPETITVTGVRASLEKSLEVKRRADAVIEVITAEDIGKLPDKNIADSLSHLSGMTISSAGATEGGFDENDRVSCRGTNASFTQTLLNGHNVASGDWFVLNQTGTVGRSVSYTLLPSELVSQVVVRKSSQAADVEGGIACSVDIITRKPLEFTKPLTLEASAGAVYADLPNKTDPQFNLLGNWKNENGNVAVMGQVFYEDRHLRRDGQELLTYERISPTSPLVTGTTQPDGHVINRHPDLANVWYPGYIGSVLFEQERKRFGGLLDVEFKPTQDVTVDAQYFSSLLNATNYNRNYILWLTHSLNRGFGQTQNPGGTGLNDQAMVPSSYVVSNGTLTSATFPAFTGLPGANPPAAPGTYGVYDQISRPDESASSNYFALDGKWRYDQHLIFYGKAGTSWGDGKTPTQDVLETNPGVGSGGYYTLNGLNGAASWNLGNTVNNTPRPGGVPVAFGWIFGDQNVDVKDQENWAQIDGEYSLGDGMLTDLRFGLRFSEHMRSSAGVIGQGPINPGASNPANWPGPFQNYPSDFASGLGGTFPRNVWYFTPGELSSFDAKYTNRNPVTREDWNSEYSLHETSDAGYVQGDLSGSRWSGNIGLRLVETREHAINNVAVSATTPGAITTSAFGPFLGVETDHSYFDVLPSANLKIDVTQDLVARFAAAETMTRPDYSALAGPVTLTPPGAAGATGSGTGSNPDLKPIRSTDVNAGLEWYFAKRSLLSAGGFYMDLHNYVSYGQVTKNFTTFSTVFPNGPMLPYLLTVPVNASGRVEGLELAYQQAIFNNFGLDANFTLANGKQTSTVSSILNGDNRLVGLSKDTYNVGGYYEDEHFNARISYTYRSAFYSGLDRQTAFSQDGIGTLGATVGYAYDKHLSATLDMLNLNNPILKYFALSEQQPRAFYQNGRQFYLNLRLKY
jgi:iron complex outermembrane receptor protein